MRLSVICPRCHVSRPGERALVAERMVTLCYCNTCGVTWTREDEPAGPAAGKSAQRRGRPRAAVASREPGPTDLLLGGSFAEGYDLTEVATGQRIAAGLSSLEEVLSVARLHGGELWQQQTNRAGERIGKPIRVSLQAH